MTQRPLRFINPKMDLAFRKIFGSDHSHDIVISFLNAMLDLTGDQTITEVEILDPYQAPAIVGMKTSILDVRVKDQSGRRYIIEMQLENRPGFTNRMLYNLCKSYVGQLQSGQPYHELADVVALAIT
ncbi:MAG: Rpn family recombination-promoting nuclease/putative transposase, partial [Magnetococcales bacterium]|nr:Rpn family recombination-promoting nuclease/putative transposase [Magnetococcales bacterium]